MNIQKCFSKPAEGLRPGPEKAFCPGPEKAFAQAHKKPLSGPWKGLGGMGYAATLTTQCYGGGEDGFIIHRWGLLVRVGPFRMCSTVRISVRNLPKGLGNILEEFQPRERFGGRISGGSAPALFLNGIVSEQNCL